MEIIDAIVNVCKSEGVHKSIILQGVNDETYQALKYKLNKDNINVAGYIDEKFMLKINGQINDFSCLINKQNEYFIIFFENKTNLRDELESLFGKFGFKEQDYFFVFHKPIILKGDIEDYEDEYGNEIKGKVYNCEIKFIGWNSKVSIDESVSFGRDSVMTLQSDCKVKFGKNISFGAKSNFSFGSSCDIEFDDNIKFEKKAIIYTYHCAKLKISKDCKFAKRFRIYIHNNAEINIDESVSFGKDSVMVLQNDCKVKFGKNISFGAESDFLFERSSYAEFEDNIKFGKDVTIWIHHCAKLMISKDCRFNARCWIVSKNNTEINIGYDVIASRNVTILGNDAHPIYDIQTGERLNFKNEKVIIGNHVWLGVNSTIIGETVIGDNCIVGAHSFLKNHTYPNNCAVAGIPAKVVRENITWHYNYYEEDEELD